MTDTETTIQETAEVEEPIQAAAEATPAVDRLTRLAEAGLTAEEAYFLANREALLAEAAATAEARALEKLTNAILSGSRRPEEAGIHPHASAPAAVDYRRVPRETRDALKKRIREAAARGERIFPGR
jgi:hypothetical protein